MSPAWKKTLMGLKQKELPYVILDPQSMDDIANDMIVIGELTGKMKEALIVKEAFLKILASYKETAQELSSKPSLYWEWWPKPVFTPGRTNWLTEISMLAGATNCFSDQPEASVQTSWDEVIHRDPDHICMVWVGVEHFQSPSWVCFKTDRQ